MMSASNQSRTFNNDMRGRPASSKDCATCKRRRIKCDRNLDGCHKCSKKNLICPGYGPRVHWVNDVATRGRLKGLQAAVLGHVPPYGSPHDDPVPSTGDLMSSDDSEIRDPPSKEVPDTSWESLIRYYKDHVARLMVWIDSNDNLYQTHVVDLAYSSPVLRLALSANSILHWNATRCAEQLALPEDIRDEAVRGITASVREVIESTTELDLEMAQWMLASMMVLSCCEMVKAGAVAADWHRRAARALVNVIKTMPWCDDTLLVFLMTQLSIYDILSCTTSFDLANVQAAILFTKEANGPIFSSILQLIHDITLKSRQECLSDWNQGGSSTQSPDHDQLLSQLRYEIEIARGETLMAAGSAALDTQAQQRDFVRLVDLHCKATLMYAQRAYHLDKHSLDTRLVEDFFTMLRTMEQPESSCQNLPWALFIAGTEVRGDPEKQRQVVTIFNEIRDATGFDHFRELIEFLRSFWSGPGSDWLSYAKEWESRGKRILAV